MFLFLNTWAISSILILLNLNLAFLRAAFHFDLHISEQHEVIKRILLYAGVIVQDPVVLQTMTSELAKDKQMDKS